LVFFFFFYGKLSGIFLTLAKDEIFQLKWQLRKI